MAFSHTFERDIRVATAGLEPEAVKDLLVQTARTALADAQNAGEFPSVYRTIVNGRVGASIESVEPPGPIVFSANWWVEIVPYTLAFAEERSPVKSGRYRRSWFAMANGSEVTNFALIPFDAEVIVTNDQPYSRKIEVGHQRVNVPPGVVEDTVSAVRRRYGDLVSVQRRFITLQGAYRLKTSSRGTRRRRSATQSGRVLTYPAAVISLRF